jgi:hypothetical protein
MVADNNEANDPPIKALIPNSDNNLRLDGANDPIPPI